MQFNYSNILTGRDLTGELISVHLDDDEHYFVYEIWKGKPRVFVTQDEETSIPMFNVQSIIDGYSKELKAEDYVEHPDTKAFVMQMRLLLDWRESLLVQKFDNFQSKYLNGWYIHEALIPNLLMFCVPEEEYGQVDFYPCRRKLDNVEPVLKERMLTTRLLFQAFRQAIGAFAEKNLEEAAELCAFVEKMED